MCILIQIFSKNYSNYQKYYLFINLFNKVSRLANVRSSFGNSSSLDERNLPNRVLKSSMSYQASDSRVDENSNQIQKFEEELTRPNTSLRVFTHCYF